MARSRSLSPKLTVNELVQQQRDALYASGHRNLRMSLPEDIVRQLSEMKVRYRLGSRDMVVARVIRKAKATIRPDQFVQRTASAPSTVYRWISPIVANELGDYLKDIQKHFRNLSYGAVFEMIFAEIGQDLSKPAVQLELAGVASPRPSTDPSAEGTMLD